MLQELVLMLVLLCLMSQVLLRLMMHLVAILTLPVLLHLVQQTQHLPLLDFLQALMKQALGAHRK